MQRLALLFGIPSLLICFIRQKAVLSSGTAKIFLDIVFYEELRAKCKEQRVSRMQSMYTPALAHVQLLHPRVKVNNAVCMAHSLTLAASPIALVH